MGRSVTAPINASGEAEAGHQMVGFVGLKGDLATVEIRRQCPVAGGRQLVRDALDLMVGPHHSWITTMPCAPIAFAGSVRSPATLWPSGRL